MDETKGDLMVNNLIYKQPKALSLAVNRTQKRQLFQRSSYASSEEAVIVWNTGSDHIDVANSYLTYKVTALGTTPTANFGSGSAANIIQRITATTRSGTEVDRHDKVNLWSKQDARNTYAQDWFDKYGTMAGFGASGVGGTDPAILSATATRFVVPLSLILGFFRPIGGPLMPPQLAAGLELRIQFADYRTALFEKTGTVTGYSISDISIMCDCTTLADDTKKTLNMESSQGGLEYSYPRIHTATSTVKSTAINSQVQKSVAQASTLTSTLVTQADVLDVTADSLACETWNVSEWQYRVGSLYYPNETIKDATVDAVESYFLAQQVYDKPRHGYAENAVSLTGFKTGGFGAMSASFEKNQSLNLTGTPLNNSRAAELNATLASWAANIELTVFLEYVAVARAYLDNVVVSI
jgi:hypothetical protein